MDMGLQSVCINTERGWLIQPDCESIEAYLERIDLYFSLLNNYLSVLQDVLRNLLLHRNRAREHWPSYELLSTHFEPKGVVVADFSFLQTEPGCRKSISEFVAELRKLSICSRRPAIRSSS